MLQIGVPRLNLAGVTTGLRHLADYQPLLPLYLCLSLRLNSPFLLLQLPLGFPLGSSTLQASTVGVFRTGEWASVLCSRQASRMCVGVWHSR